MIEEEIQQQWINEFIKWKELTRAREIEIQKRGFATEAEILNKDVYPFGVKKRTFTSYNFTRSEMLEKYWDKKLYYPTGSIEIIIDVISTKELESVILNMGKNNEGAYHGCKHKDWIFIMEVELNKRKENKINL